MKTWTARQKVVFGMWIIMFAFFGILYTQDVRVQDFSLDLVAQHAAWKVVFVLVMIGLIGFALYHTYAAIFIDKRSKD